MINLTILTVLVCTTIGVYGQFRPSPDHESFRVSGRGGGFSDSPHLSGIVSWYRDRDRRIGGTRDIFNPTGGIGHDLQQRRESGRVQRTSRRSDPSVSGMRRRSRSSRRRSRGGRPGRSSRGRESGRTRPTQRHLGWTADGQEGYDLGVMGGKNGIPYMGGVGPNEPFSDGGLSMGLQDGLGVGSIDEYHERRRTGVEDTLPEFARSGSRRGGGSLGSVGMERGGGIRGTRSDARGMRRMDTVSRLESDRSASSWGAMGRHRERSRDPFSTLVRERRPVSYFASRPGMQDIDRFGNVRVW